MSTTEMDSLRSQMHKRLAQQNRTVQSLWAYALHYLKQFVVYPASTHCVVKRATITWYVDDREDSLELHHRRTELLLWLQWALREQAFDEDQITVLQSIRIRSATQLQRDT